MIKIQEMIDDAKCYEQVRTLRWPERVTCPFCGGHKIKKRGYRSHQPGRQRYQCRQCKKHFDDLSQTPFEGHHQPLKVWILCLYFMGLDLSNHQIAQELDLNKDDVQEMTAYLRQMVYFRMSGTSMASAVTAGAVALLLQDEPNLTPDQVKYRLKATANKNWSGYDAQKTGAGYLNISAAVYGTTTQSANIG